MSKYAKVKTAVIGCGMISNIYIRNLKNLFDIIDLVAVCDLDTERAQQQAELYGVEKVMTIDEIAKSDEIELVVNLTSPVAHYSVLKQMLLAGKNVYTEKMFTVELEQAKELCKIAEENNLYIAVAPDTVLGAGIQTARKIIDSGLAGTITSGFVSVTRNQNLNSELFKFLQNNGGALPYDVGIYYIGALVALLGSVRSITAVTAPAPVHERQLLYVDQRNEEWQIPGSNIVSASLVFESGAVVSLHFNGNTVGEEHRAFELYGTAGIIKLGDPNNFDASVTLQLPESPECAFPFTHGYDGRNMLGIGHDYDHYGNRGIGVAELAYAIRLGRPNRLDQNYGLHCEEILFGIDRAAQTRSVYEMESRSTVAPLTSGYFSSLYHDMRGDAELSLIN